MKRSVEVFQPSFSSLETFKHQKTQHSFGELDPYNELTITPTRRMNNQSSYKKKQKKKRGVIRKRIPRTLQDRTKLIRVRASQYVPISMTSGAISGVSIQANSCDDPFTTGGTGQPLGYDQWKSLYRSAYVVGSKVDVTVHNADSQSVVFGITPMPLSQGTSFLSNYEHYREMDGTRSRLLSPDVDHARLISQVSTKKHLHRRNIVDENDLKLDLVNESQPVDTFYWHFWIQPTNQIVTVNSTECILDVEYYVLLTDPIVPSRSSET